VFGQFLQGDGLEKVHIETRAHDLARLLTSGIPY
jgi:hypothetical protein